ncbi:hypothetical protein ACOMHN_032432 [Nucella lapillus]
MTSSGSFNRKYRAFASAKFPREDERDILRGARSVEKLESDKSLENLSSLEKQRSPHLIFSTTNGSYVKQRQEAILRLSCKRHKR